MSACHVTYAPTSAGLHFLSHASVSAPPYTSVTGLPPESAERGVLPVPSVGAATGLEGRSAPADHIFHFLIQQRRKPPARPDLSLNFCTKTTEKELIGRGGPASEAAHAPTAPSPAVTAAQPGGAARRDAPGRGRAAHPRLRPGPAGLGPLADPEAGECAGADDRACPTPDATLIAALVRCAGTLRAHARLAEHVWSLVGKALQAVGYAAGSGAPQ